MAAGGVRSASRRLMAAFGTGGRRQKSTQSGRKKPVSRHADDVHAGASTLGKKAGVSPLASRRRGKLCRRRNRGSGKDHTMRALTVVTITCLLTGPAFAARAQSTPYTPPVSPAPLAPKLEAVPKTATPARLSEQAQIDALRAEVDALRAQVATQQRRIDSLPAALFFAERCRRSSGWSAIDPNNPQLLFFSCS